jgi:hypothetical protein
MSEEGPKEIGSKTELYQEKPGGQFKEGNPGGGRPVDSISIKTKIKAYYREHPEEFEDLCKYYRDNEDMRKLLWNYLDGMPVQKMTGDPENPVFKIIVNGGNIEDKSTPLSV